MYNSYFSLDENPFSIAPDPRFLYMSEQHREALAHLTFALKTEGGFVLLTGEVGTGKTTVCRCLLEQLPGDLNVAFVLNPKLTAGELLATVCDELDADYPSGTTSIKVLVDAINRYLLDAHAVGRRTVLIIDEAQNLSAEVLEQIRLLTNLETNQRKLLQIVMLGQPELRDLLNRPELRQLSQRITARYHLGPLNRQEVTAYIDHRLGVAGYRKKLFSDQVVGLIYRLTGGVPRLINVLCDRALLGTYVQGLDKVTAVTVKNAAREVLGETAAIVPWHRQRRFLLGVALVLGIATGLGLALIWQLLTMPRQAAAPTQNRTQSITTAPVVTTTATPAVVTSANPAASREQAYAELFQRWNLTYRSGADPCEQAARQGLACLSRQGNLGSLLRLDRPAVLELTDEQGRPFAGLLTGAANNGAILQIDGRDTTLTTAQLAKHWNGAATLLWRPPVGYNQLIHPNRQGPAVGWLADRIAQLTGNRLAGAELAQAVKEYQRNQGLLADGIAGPETIIHLDTSTGQPVPHLSRN
jgi:general secretion pathway protein A